MKKNKNKQNVSSDSTAFSKSEWYGVGRKQRKRKKPKNKIYVKHLDKVKDDVLDAGHTLLESGIIVINRPKKDE